MINKRLASSATWSRQLYGRKARRLLYTGKARTKASLSRRARTCLALGAPTGRPNHVNREMDSSSYRERRASTYPGQVALQRQGEQTIGMLVGLDTGRLNETFEDGEARDQHFPPSQLIHQSAHQGGRLVDNDGQRHQPLAQLVIQLPEQFHIIKLLAEGCKVFVLGRAAGRILGVARLIYPQLLGQEDQHLLGWLSLGRNTRPRCRNTASWTT